MNTNLPSSVFWMVYGVDTGAPTHRHHSRIDAEIEAKRLARHAPGTTFVVLEAVSAIVKREFDTVTFRSGQSDLDDDRIPF